jgi:hypothetical protein
MMRTDGSEMTDGWAYYDVDGKRVPPQSERAAFKGKEVSVDDRVPAPAGHGKLDAVEYRDVHAIDRPELPTEFGGSQGTKTKQRRGNIKGFRT